jgi:hypothetical protein
MSATLIDHLREQGYEPQEHHPLDVNWYDLAVSGTGSVRVIIYPDDYSAQVFAFDRFMACEWQASLSSGTPDAVIIATIEAAERLLADRRGGPVTPAQAKTA